MTTKPIYEASDQKIFFQLRKEVNTIIESLPQRRKYIQYKAFLFPAVYVGIYTAALLWGTDLRVLYSCYFLLGLQLVFVFLNVVHDAVHGSIFKSKKANEIYVHLFDLMGANSFIWRLRHVRFHHNYPNVNGWDTDIEQSDLFRVFPDGEIRQYHKYQHIYLPLLYPFYLFNWLVVRDFKDFFNSKKTVRKLIDIPFIEYVKLFVFKLIFFFYMLVLPKLILALSWSQVMIAFAIFLFTASIFSLIVLLSPHANTENVFPLPNDENKLPYSRMRHMMLTTNDVSHNNFFTRFFMGCFNYHVVHHLFPNVSHVYYPEITAKLKELSKEYKLPYKEYSLWVSLKNHYRLLKENGVQENIFEEAM
jgi:linoleoyl-CoA desaturase